MTNPHPGLQPCIELAKSITDDEIHYICQIEGYEIEIHEAALRTLIFDQNCVTNISEQYWHPYECVELNRFSCNPGHEREFAICTIIIAIFMHADADTGDKNPHDMLQDYAGEYDKLPDNLRELVLTALTIASASYYPDIQDPPVQTPT